MQRLTFEQLVERSKEFEKQCNVRFPLKSNRIETIGKDDPQKQREIETHACETRPILAPEVEAFLPAFIAFKQQHGTPEEARRYGPMAPDALLDRLLASRPLVFYTPRDRYRLRNGLGGSGWPKSDSTSDISMDEYINYDEICLSALLGVSVPTYFVNNGSRLNCGAPMPVDSFQPTGVYTALVGARFERTDLMESQFLLVRQGCTAEAGYGPQGRDPWLTLWAKLYGVPYFPTYEEAEEQGPELFLKLRAGYLNMKLYQKRMGFSIEPFLVDANERAKAKGLKAYMHLVGLGLGVWMVHERQGDLMVQLYADIFRRRKLAHISHLNFSYFPRDCTAMGDVPNEGTFEANGNAVRVLFSRRNPADPIPEGCLLVAMYPWDGNSFPGNEYWLGQLSCSGDPAAAACSTIGELQNPLVNPNVCAATRFTGKDL